MARTADYAYATDGLVKHLRVRINNSGTSAATYYRGSIMAVNPATGYAVAAANTASLGRLGGVLNRTVTVEAGETAEVELDVGKIWLEFSAAALTHIGTYVYATDNDTIAATATNADPVGMVVDVEAGVKALVDFEKAVPKTALA